LLDGPLLVLSSKTKTPRPETPSPEDTNSGFNYFIQLPKGLPAGGQVAWYAETFGTKGVSEDGFTLQVNATNSSQVNITVDNALYGTVVLYAYYAATNGALVFANPVVVYSNPIGTSLNGIVLEPASATLSVGDTLSVDVWGQYTNGATSLLYLSPGQMSYFSSNPSVATVDTNGTITVNSFGSATISGSYNGLTAQTVVSTTPPSTRNFYGAPVTNGGFQLSFIETIGTTNIIQASTDLITWVPIATLYNSNGFIQYQDTDSANFSERFYRIVIP
jgi:hypothetical protein